MALLQVRNFPDDIYLRIGEIAKSERRTVSQQTILLIEKGLGATAKNLDRRRAAIDRSMTRAIPKKIQEADFVEMIREDRAR
jgi:hypothetical protein